MSYSRLSKYRCLGRGAASAIGADPSYGIFDYIVCDEAHRTTGFKQKGRDESHFTKIHDNDLIRGKKRLYMTLPHVIIMTMPRRRLKTRI